MNTSARFSAYYLPRTVLCTYVSYITVRVWSALPRLYTVFSSPPGLCMYIKLKCSSSIFHPELAKFQTKKLHTPVPARSGQILPNHLTWWEMVQLHTQQRQLLPAKFNQTTWHHEKLLNYKRSTHQSQLISNKFNQTAWCNQKLLN
jgi:hypothetical protein